MNRIVTGMCLLLLLLPGCATDERARLRASQEAFAATVDTLTFMRQAGEFDPNEIERLDVLIHLGGDLLGQWKVRVLAGESSPGASDQFRAILAALQTYQRKEVDPNE